MKIRATINFDIDLTPEDIIAAMQDKDFEEFRVKLNKVAAEYHSQPLIEDEVNEAIQMAGQAVKAGIEKLNEKKHKEKPVKKKLALHLIGKRPPLTKGKKCATCGKEFQPKSNRQIKCSIECGLMPKPIKKEKPVEPVYVPEVKRIDLPEFIELIKPIESAKPIKQPKPDHQIRKPYEQPKELILHEPEGRNRRILKQNERICLNCDCRKTFLPDKFEQKYCSIKCEAHVKVESKHHKQQEITEKPRDKMTYADVNKWK